AGALAQRGRRAPPFTPRWAAPLLDVYPPGGPPGTRVRITGAEFGRRTNVYYGDRPMRILRVDDDGIVAVIPRGAWEPEFIYVVDRTGRARTGYRFDLDRRYRR